MGHIIILYYLIAVIAGIAGTTLFFLESFKRDEHVFKDIRWISLIFTLKIISEAFFSYIVLNIRIDENISRAPIYIQSLLNGMLFYSATIFLWQLMENGKKRYIVYSLTFFVTIMSFVIIFFGKIKFENGKASFSILFYSLFLYMGITGIYILCYYIKRRGSIKDECMAKLFRKIEKAAIMLIPVILIDIMQYTKGEYLDSKENIIFFFYPFVYCVLLSLFLNYTLKRGKICPKNVREKSLDEIYEEAGISQREREVITLLQENFTGNEIAEKLYISLSTVKTHTSNIYKKLSVKNRSELLKKIEQVE